MGYLASRVGRDFFAVADWLFDDGADVLDFRNAAAMPSLAQYNISSLSSIASSGTR